MIELLVIHLRTRSSLTLPIRGQAAEAFERAGPASTFVLASSYLVYLKIPSCIFRGHNVEVRVEYLWEILSSVKYTMMNKFRGGLAKVLITSPSAAQRDSSAGPPRLFVPRCCFLFFGCEEDVMGEGFASFAVEAGERGRGERERERAREAKLGVNH